MSCVLPLKQRKGPYSLYGLPKFSHSGRGPWVYNGTNMRFLSHRGKVEPNGGSLGTQEYIAKYINTHLIQFTPGGLVSPLQHRNNNAGYATGSNAGLGRKYPPSVTAVVTKRRFLQGNEAMETYGGSSTSMMNDGGAAREQPVMRRFPVMPQARYGTNYSSR